jgi:hypothetical protein
VFIIPLLGIAANLCILSGKYSILSIYVLVFYLMMVEWKDRYKAVGQ